MTHKILLLLKYFLQGILIWFVCLVMLVVYSLIVFYFFNWGNDDSPLYTLLDFMLGNWFSFRAKWFPAFLFGFVSLFTQTYLFRKRYLRMTSEQNNVGSIAMFIFTGVSIVTAFVSLSVISWSLEHHMMYGIFGDIGGLITIPTAMIVIGTLGGLIASRVYIYKKKKVKKIQIDQNLTE